MTISAGLFILSNALWGVYFWRDSWHSLEYIFGFLFITTWLVPFSLFLSVAANESVLPGGANAGMTFSSSTNNLTGDKSSHLAYRIALSLSVLRIWIHVVQVCPAIIRYPHPCIVICMLA